MAVTETALCLEILAATRLTLFMVTCSGGDGDGDPENRCIDGKPDDNDRRCPPDRDGNPGSRSEKGQDKLEAYTISKHTGERYTKVTFCNAFYLPTLGEAVDCAKELWFVHIRVHFSSELQLLVALSMLSLAAVLQWQAAITLLSRNAEALDIIHVTLLVQFAANLLSS